MTIDDGAVDIFSIKVWFGNEVYDVGECDFEHISLITLIRATIDELNGQDEVSNDDCIVWVQLPWSGERVHVNSDIELVDYFRVFEDHEAKLLNYDGDSEKDDDKNDDEGEESEAGEGEDNYGQVPIVDGDADDEMIGMIGMMGMMGMIGMMEMMRMMTSLRSERKDECEKWNSVLPPRVNATIMKNSKESRLFTIIVAGNGEYELLGPTGGYGVKLKEYSCQCDYWQISGIPCSHEMAAISYYCGRSVT
ncbi:hypothetical protein LWI28_015520 [Acer negundo]|uniref:SWIM-type domain-containing protein n=1 Tax=Acer negundo TaxID=4023 RepID=A0AAD5NQA3_ACENE|nr:hypothetical protein LWI28_015520 [Acer negundo]